MRGLHDTVRLQLHFLRAHHDFHLSSRGKGRWHFDVAATGADVSQAGAIRDARALAIDVGAQAAGVAGLSAAIAGGRSKTRNSTLWSVFRNFWRSRGRLRNRRIRARNLRTRARFRAVALEPVTKNATRRSRHIHKAHADATVSIAPYDLAGKADQRRVSRQGKLEIDPAIRRDVAIAMDRRALVAEIDEGRWNILHVGVIEGRFCLDIDTAIATPLLLHHGSGRAKTTDRSLFRNRLVEDEVHAFGEKFPYVVFAANNGCGDGRGAGGSAFLEDADRALFVFTIDDDDIEADVRKAFFGSRAGGPVLDHQSKVFQY